MRIIAATQNAHKIIEINAITKDFGLDLVSMKDVGLGDVDIEENGDTFAENSFIKADAICRMTGEPAIADDSGLCVDALGGAPGVHSARYSGVHGDDAANRKKMLQELSGIPAEKRTAHFVTVITLLYPDGKKLVAEGICPGHIAFAEKGEGGFGYDRIFIPDGYEETFAQMDPAVKNTIGHRARALVRLRELLK